MLVIGGGPGALETAAKARELGGRVCLIESDRVGRGGLPKEAFLKCCNVAHSMRTASSFGITVESALKIDFKAIMDRTRNVRVEISEHEADEKLQKHLGI